MQTINPASNWQEQARSAGGHPFEEREVLLANLQVDEYQRPISEPQVREICDEFLAPLARELQVSHREDGSEWVVDGHHTREALMRLGFTRWTARVHFGLSREEEANFFVDYNDSARRVSPAVKFRGRLFGQNPDQQEISRVLLEHGLCITGTENLYPQTNLTPLGSVVMISRLYERGGAELLRQVLTIAESAWSDPKYLSTDRFNTRVIPGVSTLLLNSTHPLDFHRLTTVLRTHNPLDLEKMVRGTSGANWIVAKRLYKDYLKGEGLPLTATGQKGRKIYKNSPNYPYLAVSPVEFNKPINLIGVWNPVTETNFRRNFKGYVKQTYLMPR